MNFYRIKKVNNILFRNVVRVLKLHVNDPRLSSVSILRVDINKNFDYVKVFFVCNSEIDLKIVFDALYKSSGFLKRKVFDKVNIKFIPRFKFILSNF